MTSITDPLKRLAEEIFWQARLARFQLAMKAGFKPDQLRDERGRWASASGGDGAGFISALQSKPVKISDSLSLRWNESESWASTADVPYVWMDIVKDGETIGRVIVAPQKDGSITMGPKIDEAMRRQGIATAVYDAIEEIGHEHGLHLKPSSILSRAAFDFWRQRDPEALRAVYAENDSAIGQLTEEQRSWLKKP